MDWIALFTSRAGRIGRKHFWFSLATIYVASLASQWLLAGRVTARSGVWPFAFVQAVLLWAWIVVHIKRLRDAGRPPAGAIAVGTLYGLAVGLGLMLVAVFIPAGAAAPVGEEAPAQALAEFVLLVGILIILFDINLGPFSIIFQALALIVCIPFVLSLTFSLYTGLRRSAP